MHALGLGTWIVQDPGTPAQSFADSVGAPDGTVVVSLVLAGIGQALAESASKQAVRSIQQRDTLAA